MNEIYLEYTNGVVPIISELKPKTLRYNENKYIETPNLFAKYFHFEKNYILEDILLHASSHVYYVIEGKGKSEIGNSKTIFWEKGDVFILPFIKTRVLHTSFIKNTILFTADDSPLFNFLNAKPLKKRFEPVYYNHNNMMAAIEKFNKEKNSKKRNRNGVLLTNKKMVHEKMNTLTHTMWSLMNVILPKTIQKPHRHNSIAVDLCVDIENNAEKNELVYTLMSKKIDKNGNLVEPIKMPWKKYCTFTTPPGWWHSHHNDSNKEAWVFPVQDAGLHTYLRTLDIQFIKD
tara:strand:- start:982 stop:1845 length:864 start_codon:yes stop_codon:yes gene_type:complete